MSFDFGSQLLSYIGWKLNATHISSEGINEKMNLALFLTSARISSMKHYRSFPDMPDSLLRHVQEIDQTLNVALLNERNFMHPQNMQDMDIFPFEEDNHDSYVEAYREKVGHMINNLNLQAIDCFYGDTLHLALARSQFYYARELIQAGFPAHDHIDFSGCDVPGHINQGFIEHFHTTLVHTLLMGLGTYSHTPLAEIKKTLTVLHEAGASFTEANQSGQTPIDILTQTRYAGERKVREELMDFIARFLPGTPKP